MIHLYEPDLSGREREYLIDAFDSTWISSKGRYLDLFEKAVADFTGIPYVATVSNGTVALHLALHCLDLQPGDEVIVPSFTYIASVNTIVQAGAVPVFADSYADDWMIDPAAIEALITPRTRAILAVHLYGGLCRMAEICAIAQRHGLAVVEDCAEALGAFDGGRHAGLFGDVATFSFFGNKTVTTGEGGMVATRDPARHRRMFIVKGQGQDPGRRYWHIELGFNYRLSNIAAAIGTAQMERLSEILARKRRIARFYRDRLTRLGLTFQKHRPETLPSEWLVTFLVPRDIPRDRVMLLMEERGVETRPTFYCAHHLPPHRRDGLVLPVAEDIAARGISIPSYPALTEAQLGEVCDAVAAALEQV